MTLRKTFEGDFKKMELTWGTAESEAKDRKFMQGDHHVRYVQYVHIEHDF